MVVGMTDVRIPRCSDSQSEEVRCGVQLFSVAYVVDFGEPRLRPPDPLEGIVLGLHFVERRDIPRIGVAVLRVAALQGVGYFRVLEDLDSVAVVVDGWSVIHRSVQAAGDVRNVQFDRDAHTRRRDSVDTRRRGPVDQLGLAVRTDAEVLRTGYRRC